MAGKKKTYKDYPTTFQITKVDKDKFVLLGILTKKQMLAIKTDLKDDYEERSRRWRGQYKALAMAIVKAFEDLEK